MTQTLTPSKKSDTLAADLPKITGSKLLKLYKNMLLIRRFEERAGQLYGMGKIGGFCHLYIGQEAVAVGVYDVMRPEDTMITAYRDHGHMLVCGMDPRGVMAELTGRVDGYSKGKGGSMHMFSREKNFFGGHGIVGASASLGTGMAFAHKYQEDGGVCVTSFGDGAANQGQTYESFNMASLWKLPVLYIIENNVYSMGTSLERHAAGPGLCHRGEPFGIPGKKVDGMDVTVVREATHQALNHVRSGKGPYLLEFNTYRYRGHSMSDPAKYRTKEEVDEVRSNRDPLLLCQEKLKQDFAILEDQLKTTEKEIRDQVLDAANFAQESPFPDGAELYTDILLEDEGGAA